MATTWINDHGRRIGEGHHRAKLSDADVEQIYALRDAGMSYGRIAAKLDHVPGGIAKSTVRDVCTGRIRAQLCAGIRREPGTARRHNAEPVESLSWTHETLIESHELPALNNLEEPGQRAMRLVCWAILKEHQ